MSILPANVGRTSNLMVSQFALANLARTNLGLLNVQTQLATGRAVNRPSDDPIRALGIAALDSRLELSDQRARNLAHAGTVLGSLDQSLTEARGVLDQARTIASSQIGAQSDADERRGFATQVDSLLQTLLGLANTRVSTVHVFGGSTPGQPPMQAVAGGYRYTARGSGLFTDLGLGDSIPITLGGANAIGEVSARLRGDPTLPPSLTPTTALASLNGARGAGVALGSVNFQFNGGPVASLSLAGAGSVQDVVNQLTVAIRQYETDNSVTILGPGGVGLSGQSISIDVVAAGSLTFTDPTGGFSAADLGLSQAAFTPTSANSVALSPRLTLDTPLSAIPALTLPLDSIRIRFTQGATTTTRDVNLASAATIDQIRNLVESQVPGVRVQVNAAGTGIDILNEIAGQNLSIEEVAGGQDTATALGIRSLAASTVVADFNHGRGVRIVNGATDPVTGLPDPARDVDFRITLGNGQAFDVDLRPQDLTDVQGILNRINAEFTAALALPPINASAPALVAGDFTAGLTSAGNGLAFVQTVAGGAIAVSVRNNSAAAEDLGLLSGAYDSATSTLLAQDRATVRVNNLFSDLLDLRGALAANDSPGIGLAGERLTGSSDRLTQAHALVGGYSQRIDQASNALDDMTTLDLRSRSELQDLDYAEAATRFSLLQTQLQASLQTTAAFQTRSLLDFLR